jgi:hypothetical protein
LPPQAKVLLKPAKSQSGDRLWPLVPPLDGVERALGGVDGLGAPLRRRRTPVSGVFIVCWRGTPPTAPTAPCERLNGVGETPPDVEVWQCKAGAAQAPVVSARRAPAVVAGSETIFSTCSAQRLNAALFSSKYWWR